MKFIIRRVVLLAPGPVHSPQVLSVTLQAVMATGTE